MNQLCVEERKISGRSRCGKKCTSWRESPFGRGSRRKYGETSVPRVVERGNSGKYGGIPTGEGILKYAFL